MVSRPGGWEWVTLHGALDAWARATPAHVAVVDEATGVRLTFRELQAWADGAAGVLAEAGVGPGDRVAYWLADRAECVALWFGASRLGAAFVPVNPALTVREAVRQLTHAAPRLLVCDPERAAAAEQVREMVPGLERTWVVGAPALAAGSPRPVRTVDPDPGRPLAVLYTSGTTGTPKGAVHTHATWLGWTGALALHHGWTRRDRLVNPYPLFHMGGAGFSAAALLVGATVILPGKAAPARLLEVVARERATLLAAVPTVLARLVGEPAERRAAWDWSALRAILTSSAPLPTRTYRALTACWPHAGIWSLYSATEILFTGLDPEDPRPDAQVVGRPVFGTEIEIRDGAGRPLPPGETGLIYGRGLSSFAGYWHGPEAFAADGWFTCRDVGFLDADGRLHLVDREADWINTGGEKVATPEVEDVLLSHPAVAEVAVVGVPDPEWGERVEAVVVPRAGEGVDPAGLQAWCRAHLAPYKVPKRIHVATGLPRGSTGKVLKRAIRERLQADRAAD
ncbi:MAG: acyl--CoA ligase [Actinomycetia bacterium]|nr:acyl--CoA ligase [Actinomycetes bacterium]